MAISWIYRRDVKPLGANRRDQVGKIQIIMDFIHRETVKQILRNSHSTNVSQCEPTWTQYESESVNVYNRSQLNEPIKPTWDEGIKVGLYAFKTGLLPLFQVNAWIVC